MKVAEQNEEIFQTFDPLSLEKCLTDRIFTVYCPSHYCHIIHCLIPATDLFTVRNISCGKIMFSQASLCPQGSVHRPRQTPLPRQISSPPPPPRRPLQRKVRVPLECILLVCQFNYRPRRRSCGKVVFSQVCVKNSVHKGMSASVHAGIHTPPHLRADTPPPNGYCCGRYASYWNAFLLMLRMYKIESSTRKTCNHCTSPFWFYMEVCLSVWSFIPLI